jgi:hypothetical protein
MVKVLTLVVHSPLARLACKTIDSYSRIITTQEIIHITNLNFSRLPRRNVSTKNTVFVNLGTGRHQQASSSGDRVSLIFRSRVIRPVQYDDSVWLGGNARRTGLIRVGPIE